MYSITRVRSALMAVRMSRFWRFLRKGPEQTELLKKIIAAKLLGILRKRKRAVPVLTEDGVIKHDLFQQLNQLIGKVCSHEGLNCD